MFPSPSSVRDDVVAVMALATQLNDSSSAFFGRRMCLTTLALSRASGASVGSSAEFYGHAIDGLDARTTSQAGSPAKGLCRQSRNRLSAAGS